MNTSGYTNACKAFLTAYPFKMLLGYDELDRWATAYGNELPPDLLIEDRTKRLNAIQRHLNEGWRNGGFHESERAYLQNVGTNRAKVYAVKRYVDWVLETNQSGLIIDKMLKSMKLREKAFENKLDRNELSDDTRASLKTALDFTKRARSAIQTFYFARLIEKEGTDHLLDKRKP
jgi:hypothetical protein